MLTNRALIRLSGEGVQDFLQGLVTNNVAGNLPVWTGLLTPQGKCLFDFLVWADEDDLLIDCDRDQAGALAQRLTLYRLRRRMRGPASDDPTRAGGDRGFLHRRPATSARKAARRARC